MKHARQWLSITFWQLWRAYPSCDYDGPTFPASRFLKHVKVKRRGSQSGRSRSSLFVQSSAAPWPGPHIFQLFVCFLHTGAYFFTAFGNRSSFSALFIPEFSAVFYSLGFAVVTEVAHVIPSSFRTMCLAVSSWRLTMFLGESWFVYWGQTMRYFIFRSGSCGSWSSVLKKVSMNCSTKFPTSPPLLQKYMCCFFLTLSARLSCLTLCSSSTCSMWLSASSAFSNRSASSLIICPVCFIFYLSLHCLMVTSTMPCFYYRCCVVLWCFSIHRLLQRKRS